MEEAESRNLMLGCAKDNVAEIKNINKKNFFIYSLFASNRLGKDTIPFLVSIVMAAMINTEMNNGTSCK